MLATDRRELSTHDNYIPSYNAPGPHKQTTPSTTNTRNGPVAPHHLAPALFLRYACVIPRDARAPSPALCSRSPLNHTGARLCTATALSSAARRRFTLGYAGALCRCRRYSLCFAALPRPSLALFPTLCRHLSTTRPLERARARSRLILLMVGLLVREPRGGAGYGARCRN